MLLAALFIACKIGCLTGTDDQCVVPSPCEGVAFTCEDGGTVEVYVLQEGDPLPVLGQNVLASPGDIVLRNGHVAAVVDGLDHPHYTAPTGGSLLDLAPVDGTDGLRNIFQATGLLPGDAVNYTEVRILETGENGVGAVQFRGTLDGHPDIPVATRYEIRPCDEGVRIRTEVVNLEPDPYPVFLVDAFYWGGREALPFTPGPGFEHPSFGLTTLADALRDVPWMATGAHGAGAASYGVTSCDHPNLQGFQSREFSAMGAPKRILMPRDYEVFERFVSTDRRSSVAGGADIAQEVRGQSVGSEHVTVSGRLVAEDGRGLGELARASLVIRDEEGDAASQVVPEADGSWHVELPPDHDYTLEILSYGQVVQTSTTKVGGAAVEVGDLTVPAVGELVIDGLVDGATDQLLVFVHPSEQAAEEALSAPLYGNWDSCAPLLGHPFGPSPACNRVLVNGPTTVLVPAGTYDLYAAAGPFTTLGRTDHVTVGPGETVSATVEVQTLPLQPAGTLSADFHVHGRQSFDSAIPDLDRVRAFLAARVEVVASTDHDVVNDYADAVRQLSADDRMRLLVGLETTGHILFPLVETTIYPKVIGHFNFWPLPYDPAGPWRGAPWDEIAEPGELFDRVEDMGLLPSGVKQMNHPWGGIQFGRDYAWPQAIGLDATLDLPTEYDGTGQGLFLRTPPGARHSNADFDTEEVMNSSSNELFQQYRAIWHYLLNQGIVRAGTANSDSHSLTDNVLGTPRNLVWSDTDVASFDEPVFDTAVRDGRMIGTNGPIIEVSMLGTDGAFHTPSVHPFAPEPNGALTLKVSAAPWVPVDEVRIIVNGALVKTITPTVVPADPFGTEDLVRLDTTLPLTELVSGSGDAWIVVEAGAPLEPNADLDCNGIPDTGDNNRDGTIDWRDVEDLEEDPGDTCFDTVGPFTEPPEPAWNTPAFFFERVTPNGHPNAFTNPLVLDRDGDGGYAGVAR
ncbi:MAG: CehA/McbA family metallohydrolase [Alphaproteobacteria bacterium]|nr:CehA/McbA family metallohydrolase [Alphaproteobacteria bacterium]MCB9699588.1 CehA/McbA family metallohydrolase [Alphaproteobacteria bacterium]